MKKLLIIAIVTAGIGALQGCSDIQRTPSRVYMPDMGYSVAYETYADHSKLADSGIFYNARPVAGTVKRGEDPVFHYEMLADTSGAYDKSAAMKNPIASLDKTEAVEAERLYLVNCGVCHGPKLDGKGPLHVKSDGTDGPYTAAPANFVDAGYQSGRIYNMPEGTMFHSITYGKNLMGSYASQVTPKQRWMIISYIKSKQQAAKPAAAPATTPATAGAAPAGKDSAAAKK
jgi:mono/diheme cytochrome c family protein